MLEPAEPLCIRPHGRKKGGHLLNVVFDIVCFLTDFHQDIGHMLIRLFKPGMVFIELIPEDQT